VQCMATRDKLNYTGCYAKYSLQVISSGYTAWQSWGTWTSLNRLSGRFVAYKSEMHLCPSDERVGFDSVSSPVHLVQQTDHGS